MIWIGNRRSGRATTLAAFITVLALSLGADPILADDSTAPPVTSKDITVPKGIKAEGGYLINLHKGDKDLGYYLIQYDGNSILSKGDAFKFSNPSAPPSLVAKDGPEGFKFRLERGQASVSGGILDSIFRKPFSISGLNAVTGSFGVNATTDLKALVFTGGLESPVINPLRILNTKGFGNLNVMNWMFISAYAESQNLSSAGGKDQDVGVTSYRAMVGKGWRPVATRKSEPFNDSVRQHIRDVSEKDGTFNYEFLKSQWDEQHKPTNWVDNILYFVVTTVPGLDKFNTAQWEGLIFHNVQLGMKDVKNFNRIQLWVDTVGWYQFNGTVPRSRFTDLTSANFRVYVGKANDAASQWIGIRYENGTERATPGVHRAFAAFVAGFSL